MLNGIIDAKLDGVDKLFPRVLFLQQALSLLFLVYSTESLFIGVAHFVLCIAINELDLRLINIYCRCLAPQLLEQISSAIDIRFPLIVALKEFFLSHRVNRFGHLIVRLVHALQVSMLWVNHVEA